MALFCFCGTDTLWIFSVVLSFPDSNWIVCTSCFLVGIFWSLVIFEFRMRGRILLRSMQIVLLGTRSSGCKGPHTRVGRSLICNYLKHFISVQSTSVGRYLFRNYYEHFVSIQSYIFFWGKDLFYAFHRRLILSDVYQNK